MLRRAKVPVRLEHVCMMRTSTLYTPMRNLSTPSEKPSDRIEKNVAPDAAKGAPSPGFGEPEERSFTSSTTKAAEAMNKQPLPYLSRPLGVQQRPSSERVTWADRKAEWFNTDKRLERRKVMIKEASQGYFHDFHAIRSHGGKTWRSPNTMIRHDVQHTRSFYEASLARFSDDPNFQLVQINLQENVLKAYLLSLFLSSLRKQVPVKLQETYLLSGQSMEMLHEPMGLHNKHVGYTYLVGPDEKIRWAGSAFAEPDESRALIACAAVLLDRLAGRTPRHRT
ncbi:Mitochondrial ATPase complex subunit atp10 [Malassezia vespertilionis]|uniref:Mitochondrial ATPase complex subunit atp10 n=1 Tax=Malassezia vespertilionis TaxID=2020962 RepID=UPI0024B1BE70|nr:Mitochondrial ATPase complex subunit atp10 [Malassezia vespertilionis]WFD05767.1 Mitochondrial ATPase complex subunit atp10 [Malassezia vespertilionis]